MFNEEGVPHGTQVKKGYKGLPSCGGAANVHEGDLHKIWCSSEILVRYVLL